LKIELFLVYKNDVINLHQKGATMNTGMKTDNWISRIVIVLGLTLIASLAGMLIRMITGHPMPEFLVALGAVATGGLIRLWISPLNQGLLE
jgi:hypothetical protein